MGEEIRQLAETGIPVVDMLAKKLGLTKEEIMKGGEAGITAERALKALFEGLNEKFGGGMVAQSKTWKGLWTTIRDSGMMVLGAFGDGVRNKIQPELKKLTTWFEKHPDVVADWQRRLGILGYSGAKLLVDAFEGAMRRIEGVMNNPAFVQADFGGKLGMLFKGLIGDPLRDWWNSSGREWTMGVATDTGQLIVNGIIAAINGTDWSAVFGGLAKGAWSATKAVGSGFFSEVLKLAPGGESPDWAKLFGFGALATWVAAKTKGLWLPLLRWAFPSPTPTGPGPGTGGPGSNPVRPPWWQGPLNLFNSWAGIETGGAVAGGTMAGLTAAVLGLDAYLLYSMYDQFTKATTWDKVLRDAQPLKNAINDGASYGGILPEDRAKIERLRNIPTTIGPAPADRSFWDSMKEIFTGTPVKQESIKEILERKEISLSVNVIRADNDDDETLADRIVNKMMLSLREHVANS